MIKINCLECGKEFEIKPYRLGKAKFCSYTCMGKNNSQMRDQEFEKNHCWMGEVISKKELKELYLNEKLSISKISQLKKVSPNVIDRRLRKYDIKKRSYHEQKKVDSELGRTKESHKIQMVEDGVRGNRRNYLEIAKKNYPWECKLCKKKKTNNSFDLVVHHINGNKKDNRVENLMVLCQGCHVYIHRKGCKNHKVKTAADKELDRLAWGSKK